MAVNEKPGETPDIEQTVAQTEKAWKALGDRFAELSAELNKTKAMLVQATARLASAEEILWTAVQRLREHDRQVREELEMAGKR